MRRRTGPPGVPPTSAYQGGAGSPFSSRATHIDRADTRSVIAPRLPNPDASGNSPQAYLAAAQRALARNQTGAAQEALERAETRILTRSTDPSMANVPDTSGIAQAITDARRALANGDNNRARSIIGQFLNNNQVKPRTCPLCTGHAGRAGFFPRNRASARLFVRCIQA